ncbi:MAG: plastocyanin/azurin family copper-binding protein [Nitrososphaerales archaeon]|nr:plastocyanin/azurin family copper-binding protein [Nitrososphaerales archaeon]
MVSRVLTLSMSYAAFVNLTGAILVGLIEGVLPLLIEATIFMVLFVVLAFASWRSKRWGYLGAGVVSLVNLALLWGSPAGLVQILQSPGGQPFALFLPYYVAVATAVPYGFYGFSAARKPQLPPRQVTRSGILAFVALGVAVGGLLVGAFAATTESRLLASTGGPTNISIVLGSSSSSNANFYLPANFTAKVGQTVTWVNRDSGPHTVTSSTGVFDSGSIASGASFSFTFTQAGTYQYYCTYHLWMKGTIVVTNG